MRSKEDDDTGRAHNTALIFPEPEERPIIFLLRAWEEYAAAYSKAHDGEVIGEAGDGSVEKRAWIRIGRAISDLALQDIGRLRSDVLRRSVRTVFNRNGVCR